MRLSDKTIKSLVLEKDLIQPFNQKQLQPASYDLTLDPTKALKIIHINTKPEHHEIDLKEHPFIYPGDFLLASTNEIVNVPDFLAGEVKGKSSVGRLGLQIQNAGFIDPGFSGNITLELFNSGSLTIDLLSLPAIGQIAFDWLDFPAENPYNGHYVNQKGVTKSWLN